MPFKTYERFGEISASELLLEEEIKVKQRNGIYLGGAVALAIGIFLYIGNILFNSTEVVKNPWLNRCDLACQSVLNVDHIAQITSCIGLENLFNEPQKNYPIKWKLLVDDRATYLGCSGFPKTMEQIGFVQEQNKKVENAKMSAQEKRVEEIKAIIADKQGRFQDAVQEGSIRSYVVRVWQSGANPSEMNIETTPNFQRLSPLKKEQIAIVLWQKWGNVFDHRNPYSASIIFYDSNIDRIGSSSGPNNTEFLN